MVSTQLWAGLGSALGVFVGMMTMAMHHDKMKIWINKITAYLSPYMQITIHEYGPERFHRSDFFVAIEAYLSHHCALGARKLKAELDRDSKKPQASIDDDQEIIDNFKCGADGATLWWHAGTEFPQSTIITYNPGDEKRRFYRVKFHKKFRESVLDLYLPQVIDKGRGVIAENRHRRLFTNTASRDDRASSWSHVAFQHPATFAKLAMDPTEKEAIIDDLKAFKEGKEFYDNAGKAWKRGYLLFGPPGTGKSTMIAAMARYLDYDVYDLELTAVKDNTELRKLFVETKGKSIIVIEDIDRSVDLTAAKPRSKKKARNNKSNTESDSLMKTLPPKKKEDKEDGESKLTLSGLLNFIDGLWSSCGGERVIIFTTNHKDKLDPALIRRGRMDKHIEMSYCRYEAFKVLAGNYLKITEHQMFELFGEIQQLLEEVDMTPADVAEHLRTTEKRDADACLRCLVEAMRKAKHDAAVKDKVKAKEGVEIVHGKKPETVEAN